MKLLSEKQALGRLSDVRKAFAGAIRENYEHKAEPCVTCATPGACCLDAHFVNVRISRLETAAIRNTLDELPPEIRERVDERIVDAIAKYKLDEALDTTTTTYACPLFEKGVGCLVHTSAKPTPCIAHACYADASDLPPDALLDEAEQQIERLNRLAYGRSVPLLPIPLAIRKTPSSELLCPS